MLYTYQFVVINTGSTKENTFSRALPCDLQYSACLTCKHQEYEKNIYLFIEFSLHIHVCSDGKVTKDIG